MTSNHTTDQTVEEITSHGNEVQLSSLVSIMKSYHKKMDVLSRIIVGNGEIKGSVIWVVEELKKNVLDTQLQISKMDAKLDNIANMSDRIKELESFANTRKGIENTLKSNLNQYFLTILISVSMFIGGSFVISKKTDPIADEVKEIKQMKTQLSEFLSSVGVTNKLVNTRI